MRTTTRTLLRTLPALALAVLSACGGDEPAAAAPAGATSSYTCKAQIARKTSGSYSGEASDADAAKADEAAWTAACAQLPEAERPGCRDEEKFSAQRSTASASGGGPTTHTAKVTLTPIPEEFSGAGTSERSAQEACDAARAEACKHAGAAPGCVDAGGGFTQTGVASSSRRRG